MIDLKQLTPAIGSEVEGIDLRRPCTPGELSDITEALVDRKVLVFRDQDLTTDEHVAWCRQFGELEVHPFAPSLPGHPEVMAIVANEVRRGNENTWHSDVTWREEPSLGSILRAVEIPEVGGDTLFADMEAAYDDLEPELKDRIDGLTAEHDLTWVASTIIGEEAAAGLRDLYPPSEHPVVRTHPVSGRRSIYVNAAFTTHIVGLDPDESAALLEELYRRASVPEHQCRVRWEPGTVVWWDNRSTQHYAVSDYWPSTRIMERVTIAGDRPR